MSIDGWNDTHMLDCTVLQVCIGMIVRLLMLLRSSRTLRLHVDGAVFLKSSRR